MMLMCSFLYKYYLCSLKYLLSGNDGVCVCVCVCVCGGGGGGGCCSRSCSTNASLKPFLYRFNIIVLMYMQ